MEDAPLTPLEIIRTLRIDLSEPVEELDPKLAAVMEKMLERSMWRRVDILAAAAVEPLPPIQYEPIPWREASKHMGYVPWAFQFSGFANFS